MLDLRAFRHGFEIQRIEERVLAVDLNDTCPVAVHSGRKNAAEGSSKKSVTYGRRFASACSALSVSVFDFAVTPTCDLPRLQIPRAPFGFSNSGILGTLPWMASAVAAARSAGISIRLRTAFKPSASLRRR